MRSGGRAVVRAWRILLLPVLVVCILAGVVAPPARGAGLQTRCAAADAASVTTNYVEGFYPLWFTYRQTQLAPHNQLIGPNRISPLYQTVVAINDDTLYASSPIDLTSTPTRPYEPVIVTVPQTDSNLSYSVLALDPYGNVLDLQPEIPSKPAGTDLPTTVYALVRQLEPAEDLPTGAVQIVMPADFTFLIFRIDRYTGTTDMTAQADAFRRSLLLQTSTGYNLVPTGGATRILPEIAFAIPFKTIADTLIRIAPIRFLQQLQEAVHSTNTPPLTPQEQALSDDFDALFGQGGAGLGPAEKIVFGQATRSELPPV